MSFLGYPNRRNGSGRPAPDSVIVVWIVFLVSLPTLSVLGMQLFPSTQTGTVLFLLVSLLATIPLLVAFDRIPGRLLGLAVVTTALALLYATSLSSAGLRGTDIHREYYYANLVKTQFKWDSSIPDDFNAMLSIVILAPVCSLVSGIPLMWVFKAIYPLLFSSVPLILYYVFRAQTDGKTAFLSVFFFVSIFTFYTEMIGIARQEIAEIFLALMLLVITSGVLATSLRKRAALLMVFGPMLALSHYALAFIFMGFSAFVLLLSVFQRRNRQRFLAEGLKSRKGLANFPLRQSSSKVRRYVFTLPIVLSCIVIAIGWFLSIAGSVTFERAIGIVGHIASKSLTDFFNPQSAQGLFLLVSGRGSVLHDATRMFHIAMQVFLTLGLLATTLGKVENKFDREYLSFSFASFVLLAGSIAMPFLASSLNTTRIYHIALIFLAPFCVLGMVAILMFARVSKTSALKFSSVVLSIFLLFNTGMIYYLANDDKSILNPNWALEYGGSRDRLVLYNGYVPADEVKSAEWLSRYRDSETKIYADTALGLAAYGMILPNSIIKIGEQTDTIDKQSYVYLRRLNIFDGLMQGRRTPEGVAAGLNATSIISSLSGKAAIVYSNNGSEIYYTISSSRFNDVS